MVRFANDRIYVSLGDQFEVNFRDIDHMLEVRQGYRQVLKKGVVPGSLFFTTQGIEDTKRRLKMLNNAIYEVEQVVGVNA